MSLIKFLAEYKMSPFVDLSGFTDRKIWNQQTEDITEDIFF